MKKTLAAAAAVAVLGFSGVALAQESGNFNQNSQQPVATYQKFRLFGQNRDPGRIVTSSTTSSPETPVVRTEPRFRWNEHR